MISIAEVTRTEQVSTGIRFFAHITSLGNEEKEIVYVSPFFCAGHSCFFALPSIFQKIVLVRPQDDEFL